jgi:hypothetical protein
LPNLELLIKITIFIIIIIIITTSSDSSQGQLTSTASVTIIVNEPPSPGLFHVSPKNGTELLTSFTMSASLWVDPDLPLQYAFGFIDATGEFFYHVFIKVVLY